MKRFGSISPFLEQGQTERRIGRLVANHDFIKALLRYGSFDQYVLANPSVANHRDLIAAFDAWGLDAQARARVRGIPLVDLPSVIARDAFHVFHVGGWGAFMPGLHHLRARHACNRWPITGMIFSIHGRDIFDYAVRLAHAQLCPYDAISCLSRDGRDGFAKLLDVAATVTGRRFAGRLEPLPLGLDDDVVDAKGDREAARRRLRIAPDAVVLLVLGRITPTQKMDLAPLLKAFAHQVLPRAETPIVLVMAGGASDADARLLDELVAAYGVGEHTRFHANFVARVKPDLLACADVLVAATDNTQETFGLSLLEGQSAGLPVVASRFDGYKDLVEDGVDGFLIDTWWCAADPLAEVIEVMDPNIAQLVQAQSVAVDMTQLADRVLTLAHDPALRARMGEAGRRKVDREYRFSVMIRRYEAWWDGLAREAAAAPPPVVADRPDACSPHEIFAGYPSRLLGPGDLVVAVPGAVLDASYVELRPLLDPQLLGAIIAAAAQATPIAPLAALAPTPSGGWFAVMWLLKYGILRRFP